MSQSTHSSYLLTEDLGEKMSAFRQLGLKTPSPSGQFVDTIQQDLADSLQKAIGSEYSVVRIKMRDLSDDIIGKISQVWGDDVYVVSTCPEISYPAQGATVQINRLVDHHGNALGLGARPGHKALTQQFAKIAADSRSEDMNVVIAEDGMFKGETMTHVVRELIKAGAKVVGVVAGFTFSNDPVEALAKLGVRVDVVHEMGPILDWVPDHDFLPFVPGCGKVLGTSVGSLHYPFYDHHHATFNVPYIAPFGPVTDWASIPEEKVNAFSAECINLSLRIIEEIERLNDGRRLAIGDILQSRQRVSIPISIAGNGVTRSHCLPGKDSLITTFLAESL